MRARGRVRGRDLVEVVPLQGVVGLELGEMWGDIAPLQGVVGLELVHGHPRALHQDGHGAPRGVGYLGEIQGRYKGDVGEIQGRYRRDIMATVLPAASGTLFATPRARATASTS